MLPQNRYPAGSTQYIFFATYGSSGQSITMTNFAVTDIEIYKNGSVTQRASDSGLALLDTDGTDFDGIVGLHGFSIDLSDNADAGFYAVGSKYVVVVSVVTVDGQTLTFIADRFEIVAAEAIAGKPKVDVDAWLGTAAATPTVAGVPEVDVTHWGGTAIATAVVLSAANIAADTLTAAKFAADVGTEFADALLDRANGIETGLTPRQALRLVAAVAGGELVIAGGTWTFRNAVADTADRLVATVDGTGRTAMTYNL